MAETLQSIAKAMVSNNRGILAADESTGTIQKRFDVIKVENVEENRRAYRDLLFNTPNFEKYISGVILFDETIRQKAADGTPFPELLRSKGVIPGIKVDKGTKPLAGCPDETTTEGLDGLRERLQEYYNLGARFAKWRAVITIGDGIPTDRAIRINAFLLASYSALCQERGIVPIVEPEVLMDGDHDIDRCFEVTSRTLKIVFEELRNYGVALDGIVLKPNMVIAGEKCPKKASPQQVAEMTVKCLKEYVPASVPGIAFLSGGQSEEEATLHLSLMNAIGGLPWPLTFSYGRALQQSTQKAWSGHKGSVGKAQEVFAHRAAMNSLACAGKYTDAKEKAH